MDQASTVRSVSLHTVVDPAASTIDAKPTLTLLHGFTQNSKCWTPFDTHLAQTFRIERIDLPGHGHSYDDDADLAQAADLCLEVATGQVWLGYSLGGRVALHMALAAPQRCRALVLIGAHPGITDATQRHERACLDDERAAYVEAVGTRRFVDEWLALPLFSGLKAPADHRAARYENRSEGLAGSLRNCSTGRQEPLWDRIGELAMPILYLAGDDDHKFVAIGTDFAGCVGANATFASIGAAGHSCHLEQPSSTASTVLEMLSSSLRAD